MRLDIYIYGLLFLQIFASKSEASERMSQTTSVQTSVQTAQLNQEQEIKTMTEKAIEEGKMEILPCGNKPNCVSTAGPESHKIPRWRLIGKFSDVKDLVKKESSQVLTDEENFLHVVFQSRIFRFPDDVILKNVDGTISMRSSSRIGYSDMGVNGRRMQKLASELREKNIIQIED